MEKLIFVGIIFSSFLLSAQCIEYTYDAAGNRTGRSNVCTLLREDNTAVRAASESINDEKEEVIVSPNPAMDRINVNIKGFGIEASMMVLDAAGRQVMQPKAISEHVDISGLIPGLYVIVVSDDRRKVAVTFLKE